MVHGQLGDHQDPRNVLCKAACHPASPQHVLADGIIHRQDFAFLFVELHEVSLCPILQLGTVLLHGSTPVWCVSFISSSQFYIISKLYCFIQVINEEIKQYWPQYQPLEHCSRTLCHWSQHAEPGSSAGSVYFAVCFCSPYLICLSWSSTEVNS